MLITYFALKPVQVGSSVRNPGDLIPEANDWPYLAGYVQDGKIAPVLVATLPVKAQEMLVRWEQATGRTTDATSPGAAGEEVGASDDLGTGEPDAPAAEPKTEGTATKAVAAKREKATA